MDPVQFRGVGAAVDRESLGGRGGASAPGVVLDIFAALSLACKNPVVLDDPPS